MNPEVDWFFEKPTKWQKAYRHLRELVLACGLDETLKWGCPCYTHGNANIVLIHGFKEYCALLFMKGALMKDPKGLLIQQTKNVQSARQIRFASLDEVTAREKSVKAYVREAVKIENAGLVVKPKRTEDFEVPEAFQNRLDEDATLEASFRSLTPGRQRAYLLYFAQAKQARTREARVQKCIPAILQGRGFDD
jgi:uncharacterized protein YdeI (YjbR/CyaY-like superfamily)